MIGMKDQCFGVEVEMTGLTRRQAAQALANYFGTEPYYVGGGYDKWSVKDPDGKVWSIMSDSSIVTEMKTASGYIRTGDIEYRVEMVTRSYPGFRSVSVRCAMPGPKSTTPAVSMFMWTPPTTTARV